MLRFEAAELKNPPASEVDLPKSEELKTPFGAAMLTLFKTLCDMTAKFSE